MTEEKSTTEKTETTESTTEATGGKAEKQETTPDTKTLEAQLKAAEKRNKEFDDRVQAMDAKIAELLDEKKAEKRKREEAAQEAARKAGDIEALEKSWNEKLSKREKELLAQVQERDGWIQQSIRDTKAASLASSLAVEGSAELLVPQFQKRIGVEVRDGRPAAVVLDEEGKPSALSFEELAKEIAAKPANAPIIIASRSTGGGAKGGQTTGGAGRRGGDPSKMSVAEKAAFIKDNGLAAWNQLIQSNQPATRRT